MSRTIKIVFATILAATTFSGCAPFRLDTPTGFAKVSSTERSARYKANDEVGLAVNVFDNVDGGTLAYWSEDLVTKLGRRGYQLLAHQPMKAANGVEGTRFDFAYDPPGDDPEKFYVAVLFVTDRHRVVMQLAGDREHYERHGARTAAIVAEMTVRGCKAIFSLCNSGQPETLTPTGTALTGRARQAEPRS